MVPEPFYKRNVPLKDASKGHRHKVQRPGSHRPLFPLAEVTEERPCLLFGFLPVFLPLLGAAQLLSAVTQVLTAGRGLLAGSPEPPRHCKRSPPGGSREPLPALQLTSPCLPGSGSFLDLRSQDVNWANDFPFVLAKGPSCGRRDKHDVLLDNEILLRGVFLCKHLEFHLQEMGKLRVGMCYGLDSGSL